MADEAAAAAAGDEQFDYGLELHPGRDRGAGRGLASVSMAKGKGKRKAAAGDVATNRQASYRYNLIDRWEAGLELTGTEVKSLRTGQAQMKDAYAMVSDGEVWLHNMHIPPYGRRRARTTTPSGRASCC